MCGTWAGRRPDGISRGTQLDKELRAEVGERRIKYKELQPQADATSGVRRPRITRARHRH